MSTALRISLESLEKGPLILQGALPGRLLELDEKDGVRKVGDLVYQLKAEKQGSEVLVTGEIEAGMELECARSGLFFSTIVRESAFLRDYSTGELCGELDLTEEIREAVLLQIPGYPVSPEALAADFPAPRLPPGLGGIEPEGESSPWKDLDQLNL